MNSPENLYALITGGSQGIGKAMAWECASRGMNLIIAALPDNHLEKTAELIRSSFPVKIQILGIDLTEPDSPQRLYHFCRNENLSVNMLINNAGITGSTVFEKASPDYIDLRLHLNIRALVLLTRFFIPDMKKMDAAHILNVGSMSAFYPIPFKSLYSASKTFVLSFTKSLREELKESSISVSIVCPSGVRTNPQSFSRIDSHGTFGKLTQIPAEKIAQLSISGVMRGKRLIIPGRFNRFLYVLGKIIPEQAKLRLLYREFKKELAAGKQEPQ